MKEYEGKIIKGVYACYKVTSDTATLLRKISEEIKNIMNEIPHEKKPLMKAPDSYHMTLEFTGEVADILSYVDEVQKKKKLQVAALHGIS